MAVKNAYRCAAKGEFPIGRGSILAVIFGCILSVQVLQFWVVNGITDFSAAIFLTNQKPIAFLARVIAYIAIVPVYLTAKVAWYYYSQPAVVKRGHCPRKTDRLFSLDWFTSGILLTTLPMAMQNLVTFVLPMAVGGGLLIASEVFLSETDQVIGKMAGLTLAVLLFVWLSFSGVVASTLGVPEPASIHPLLTFKLSDATVDAMMTWFNSIVVGPLLTTGAALAFNVGQGQEAVYDTPGLKQALQSPEAEEVVFASTYLGTVAYLAIDAVITGNLIVLPPF